MNKLLKTLPLVLEDIILDYKLQMEVAENKKILLKELNIIKHTNYENIGNYLMFRNSFTNKQGWYNNNFNIKNKFHSYPFYLFLLKKRIIRLVDTQRN